MHVCTCVRACHSSKVYVPIHDKTEMHLPTAVPGVAEDCSPATILFTVAPGPVKPYTHTNSLSNLHLKVGKQLHANTQHEKALFELLNQTFLAQAWEGHFNSYN